MYNKASYIYILAFCITGATLLNTPALLTLLHPVHWHYRPLHPSSSSSQNDIDNTAPHSKQIDTDNVKVAVVPRMSSVPHERMKLSGGELQEKPNIIHNRPSPGKRIRRVSEGQYLTKYWASSLPNTVASTSDIMGSYSLMGGSGMLRSVFSLDQQQLNLRHDEVR